MKTFFALLFFIVSILMSYSQNLESYQYKNYVDSGDTLNYRMLIPKDFDKNKKYPLVLFMHGAGERGNDNKAQLIHGASLFLKEENRRLYNSFVIFPQCDSNDYWANINYSHKENGLGFSFKENPKPLKSLSLVIKLMDSIVQNKNVDTNRVYITGLSMGGMGTFELLYHRPTMFAAALPICGGANPKLINSNKKNIPIWIFHGSNDTVVNPIYSVKMVEAFLKEGGTPKFTLYDNTGHDSWNKAFIEPDFLKWMFDKVKID